MKRIIIVLLLLVGWQVNNLHAQTWIWEKGFGGNADDEGLSITTDPAGYVYVTGKYSSATLTFGAHSITNAGQIDVFVAKFDAAGNNIWARTFGGTLDDQGRGIAADAHGNVYVIGSFGSASMTIGATTLTCNGQYDFFMAKLDSAGNPLWAKSAGGTNYDYGWCVTTDAAGFAYFGGYYTSSSITFGAFTLPGGGQSNIAVAKYDSLGNCIWAKHPTGKGFLYGVSTDPFGHLFLGGTMTGATLDFGNSVTLASSGNEDAFIARYDTSGLALWARRGSGTGSDWAESVAADPAGNAYLTGTYNSTTLTFGSHAVNNGGSYDYFLAKYDSSGNALWADRSGGTVDESPFCVCTDYCWNVYVTGVFTSPTMQVGNSTLTNAGVGNNDIFVSKYDSAGNVLWAKRGGGDNEDFGYGITSNLNNDIYHTGWFASDSVSFGANQMHNQGNPDIFIGKIGVSIKSSFNVPDTAGCAPFTVNFNNTSINGNTYHWNFGDGNTSTLSTPSHTYNTPGTYTVSLIIINNSPCGLLTDTMVKTSYITVIAGSVAAFVADTTNGCNPLTINFTNNSTGATTYLWDFGDGNTSTSLSPSHTYTALGTYTVTLITYTANGCNDTLVMTNYIHVTPLINVTCSFTLDSISGCIPFVVNFTNNSTNATTYLWSFGDGITSTSPNPNHVYVDSGTYNIILIAYNNSTCGMAADTFIFPTQIKAYSPVPIMAKFTPSPLTGCAPLSISFTNTCINAGKVYWDFGDGSQLDSSWSPFHVYDTGAFHVTLIAANPANKCIVFPDTTTLDVSAFRCQSLFIPNIFTPNKDGYNDLFTIDAVGYADLKVQIFNRWGDFIYSWTGDSGSWDGYNAPEGTYYYVFTAKDYFGVPIKLKGFFTLMR